MSALTHYPYPFARAVIGFFELPIENARRILPEHVEPIEMHHGATVLSVSAFDFRLEGGFEYQQILMSVVVAPCIRDGVGDYPRSALYAFAAAASHHLAREEAASRWRLPQWNEDVTVVFEEREHSISAHAADAGGPILDLTVSDYRWEPESGFYQCLMADTSGLYMACFTVEGKQSEHEEGTGMLRLHDHPFNRDLDATEIDGAPIREVWIRNGAQIFDPLIRLSDA
ncbi:MAG: hypothetical protein JXO72_09775 [Vicinamibacteria bacterium]|nr:hypothetical protein [Vicinamibacteria bacterium]